MTTFPLSFPAVGTTDSSFGVTNAAALSMSPFTGQQKAYDYDGAWWGGQVTFRPMNYSESGAVRAFLAALRGTVGTFLYGDPDYLARGRVGAGGTVRVNGAGQVGTELAVDGMTPSTTILAAGDYFQLGSGEDARLYIVTEPLVSDGSGAGTLVFEPSLRVSPSDDTILVVDDPKCAMRLAENNREWRGDRSSVTNVTVAFQEAL